MSALDFGPRRPRLRSRQKLFVLVATAALMSTVFMVAPTEAKEVGPESKMEEPRQVTPDTSRRTTAEAIVAETAPSAIRAAFFYPWFPNAWNQGGVTPFTNYTPTLGLYDSSAEATIHSQLALADDAHIDAFITSWWGPGHHTDDAMPALLDATISADSPDTSMGWAVYYEEEGQSDPSAAAIASDLDYLSNKYFSHPAYLRVDGKPVVFVWADAADGTGMAQRWSDAQALFGQDVFVVLKVFSGYRSVVAQPDSWHQYGPAESYSDQAPYSATVSPGFWLKGEAERLPRDLDRFTADVVAMNNSGAYWQLITAWNEWGEGTSVEPAEEYGTDYLAVLAANPPPGRGTEPVSTPTPTPTTPPAPTPTPNPAAPGSFTFTAGGDIGGNSRTDTALSAIATINPSFHLALGDMSYSNITPEAAWCDYVESLLGDIPMQLVVGNHEDDDRVDGFIGDFAACMPDRMNSTGVYGAEYYFDIDNTARVIMIGAGNDVNGVKYDYEVGNSRYEWLEAAIDDARSQGIQWIVVGMHKVCITAGQKACEVGTDLMDLLIDKRVDLVLHGHDHSYQRSKQLTCAVINTYQASCVADDGSDNAYTQGEGTVFVIAGITAGSSIYDVDTNDPEFPYFAEWMGGTHPLAGRGFVSVDVSSQKLTLDFVGTSTSYTDHFEIANDTTPTPDTLCSGEVVTVDIGLGQTPTIGDDVIIGTAGADDINGLAGDDIICGGGGNDTLHGGLGIDTMYGEDGADLMYGGPDDDRMYGGDGDDRVYGHAGADELHGGAGTDRLYGGSENDVITGGTGPDRIYGHDGNDALDGGAANDTIYGGDGDDTITGLSGADVLRGGAGNDHITGGVGADDLHGQRGAADVCDGSDDTDVDTAHKSCETAQRVP